MTDVMFYEDSIIFDVDDPDFVNTDENANSDVKIGEYKPWISVAPQRDRKGFTGYGVARREARGAETE